MNSVISLGSIRISNQHVIQLKSYDPYPATGPISYRITADEIWTPFTQYQEGQWVAYYNNGNPNYYIGEWNPATNMPQLDDADGVLAETYYLVSQGGTVNLGSGFITFVKGDLIVYDGFRWVKLEGKQYAYICTEDHLSTSNFDNSKWYKNQLPPYYQLDSETGVLHASLGYISIYSETYEFYVRLDKQDQLTQQIGFSNQLFNLVIRGPVDNDLFFESMPQLGTINRGYLSELAIVPQHRAQSVGASIELISGQLPTGLAVSPEGSIYGRVAYSTALGDYQFIARAKDQYSQTLDQTFTISVSEYDGDQYTQIFVKPFLKRSTRSAYSRFISNTNIFQRELLYRPEDPYFGIQYDIRLYLEYGIQQANLSDYIAPMKDYFYQKKLWFGTVETVAARDSNDKHVYDVIYVNVIDPLVRTLPFQVVTDINIYPNSIEHMRNALETMTVGGQTVKTDEFMQPLWMRSVQPDTGVPVGYKPVIVLCYCKPGAGAKIIKNIQQSEFQFNLIDFEIDRIVVENNLTVGEVPPRDNSILIASDGSAIINRYDTRPDATRYLIFSRRSTP
jgi:hypothetical protein